MKFYKVFDDVRAAIVDDHIFMYMSNHPPKYGPIVDNPIHVEIAKTQPQITKEEFEKDIPSKTAKDCLFKAMYLVKVEKELIMSN